mgnify:CR=1 FL=1
MKERKKFVGIIVVEVLFAILLFKIRKNAELPFYDKTYILLIFIPVVAAAVVAEIAVAVAKLDGS